MIQTPNLGLEKYELTDAANLADGYNSSMDTLDKFAGKTKAHFPVQTNDIADNAITGAKLNNGAVTTDKIVDANVTPSKLAAGAAAANIGKGGVTSDMLAAGAAAANIGKGGVTSDMLAAGAAAANIGKGGVTSGMLAANSVTNKNIVDNSITINKLANNIFGHNYILLGDSFSIGIDGNNNTSTVANGGWATRFKTMMAPYCNVYTASDSKISIGAGNTGFASSQKFQTIIEALYNSNIMDTNTITDIIVLAGTNDIPYETNIENAIKIFANYCHTHFKNAKIYIGALGTNIKSMFSTIAPKYKTCEKYGCGFIEETKNLMCIKSYVGSDGTHLTSDGYSFYQPYINEAIISKKTYFEFYVQTSATPNKVTGTGNIGVGCYATPYMQCIKLQENFLPPIMGYSYSTVDPVTISAFNFIYPFKAINDTFGIGAILDTVLDSRNNPYVCGNGQLYVDTTKNTIQLSTGYAMFDWIGGGYSHNHRYILLEQARIIILKE